MSKIKKRVGVYMYIDKKEKTVGLLGNGTFLGCEIPDNSAMGLASELREKKNSNPKILLDNGDIVWGCECFWNDEEEMRVFLEGYKKKGYAIISVNIEEQRQRQREMRIKEIKKTLEKKEYKCQSGECNKDSEYWMTILFATFNFCKEHYKFCKEYYDYSVSSIYKKEEYFDKLREELKLHLEILKRKKVKI